MDPNRRNEEIARRQAREDLREMERFESLTYGVSPPFARCVRSEESWENRIDAMERENVQWDDDGRLT